MTKDGPKLIPNSLGRVLTPSIVGWDEKQTLLVGDEAREYLAIHPERCASLFKRHMGSEWTASLAGKVRSATELSSLVLHTLKADAENYLGEKVERAVITVPAYFNEEQRRATIEAGRLAGLHADRILNEPTAAAIAYGLHAGDAEKIAVVVDLGGGTFDVSIVEMFEGTLEIRASAGEIFLGGEDFTSLLMSQILTQHGMTLERTEMEHPLLVSRLRRECDQAKRLLTKQPEVEIRFPSQDGGFIDESPIINVTREQFESWTNRVLNKVMMPIRRALGDANLKRGDIDEVILVGGATRMPCFVNRIEELFGQTPRCSFNPDEVVAIGAAINGGIIDRREELQDLVVTDVSPFTLGVEIAKDVGLEERTGYFLPVINRNSTIPISRIERVETRSANQSQVKVSVYQGESRLVKENILLGEFEVNGIPNGPAGQPIDIRFTYDLNGVLEVEATVVETKRKCSQVFTRHAKGMGASQVKKAVEQMQALKTHPRDEQENRFLLRRAERLYAELPLRERQLLDGLLSGFEEVLELRDKEAIEKYVEQLREFVAAYDTDHDEDDAEGFENEW
jgi:molecular chaperone HscC